MLLELFFKELKYAVCIIILSYHACELTRLKVTARKPAAKG
jgi:hypothetical protein